MSTSLTKRLALGAAVVLIATLAACKGEAPAPGGPAKGPGGVPQFPPYQMRAEQPVGNRLVGGRDPQAVFEHQCGYCHLPGGMGTNLLTKQRIMAGQPPETGILANRTDLTADYVKAVVRNGKNAMPPQTRVDMTDAELDAVAGWLARKR
ncbi:c-type cytochrome [Novosphingobium sp. FSY-8]|uniref:C-type cytochrome n=1 Tax=Novosphingobium ovatum TaxID=1908523 RepID=A0ABW9XDJ2_9SPHN|nr:cytochrome c [Novosphingobium ovatum]NBC36562.1 c-type cytochrome [Novosphingobium ovatum]